MSWGEFEARARTGMVQHQTESPVWEAAAAGPLLENPATDEGVGPIDFAAFLIAGAEEAGLEQEQWETYPASSQQATFALSAARVNTFARRLMLVEQQRARSAFAGYLRGKTAAARGRRR